MDTNFQVMDLPSSTQAERESHNQLLLDLEAKKVAASLVDVPTLPHLVADALRNLGQPIRLFGENHANVRNRLRLALARTEIQKRGGAFAISSEQQQQELSLKSITDLQEGEKKGDDDDVQTTVKYTHATEELIQAREQISVYSLKRSQDRLQRERKRRWGGGERRMLLDIENGNKSNVPRLIAWDGEEEEKEEAIAELDEIDKSCKKLYGKLRNTALEGSQYGDGRTLSAICTSKSTSMSSQTSPKGDNESSDSLIATGGWSGSIKLWDGSSSALDLLSTKAVAHEDRIMGIAMNYFDHNSGNQQLNSKTKAILGTASIDLTGKLWKVQKNDDIDGEDVEMKDDNDESKSLFAIEEAGTLEGHQARLCSIAFHPSGNYVGTTSFDHTWRLWDVESGGKEILLQDGHWKEVYGIGFHQDGSLVSTTDFGGIVQVWDLRRGVSACHFSGHAQRVICSEFSPNGFQMATAGDDGTIKIWDLRQRKEYASIPAHSRLITQLKFASDENGQNGEFLTSASFDGTAKVWSTRDWKLLSTLRGHEGKVMGIDVLGDSDCGIVTCGYDKTLKIWR